MINFMKFGNILILLAVLDYVHRLNSYQFLREMIHKEKKYVINAIGK